MGMHVTCSFSARRAFQRAAKASDITGQDIPATYWVRHMFHLWRGRSSQVPAGGRVDDVYNNHGSSDAGVFRKSVRSDDMHPVNTQT